MYDSMVLCFSTKHLHYVVHSHTSFTPKSPFDTFTKMVVYRRISELLMYLFTNVKNIFSQTLTSNMTCALAQHRDVGLSEF